MPSNTYYSIDEYYTDDNSVGEQSSHNSEHSFVYERRHSKHKCNCCQEKQEPHQHKCCNRDDSRRNKCNRCGKYHRHCEEKERKCKCERHTNKKCKNEDNIKCDKHHHNKCKCDDSKCIIIKIRPCK